MQYRDFSKTSSIRDRSKSSEKYTATASASIAAAVADDDTRASSSDVQDGTCTFGTHNASEYTFPERLQYVLQEMAKDGYDDVACWLPHGRAFIIHKPEVFARDFLPLYVS